MSAQSANRNVSATQTEDVCRHELFPENRREHDLSAYTQSPSSAGGKTAGCRALCWRAAVERARQLGLLNNET